MSIMSMPREQEGELAISRLLKLMNSESDLTEKLVLFKQALKVFNTYIQKGNNEIEQMLSKVDMVEKNLGEPGVSGDIKSLADNLEGCLAKSKILLPSLVLLKAEEAGIQKMLDNRVIEQDELNKDNEICTDTLKTLESELTLQKICSVYIGRLCKNPNDSKVIDPVGKPNQVDINNALLDILQEKCIGAEQPGEKASAYFVNLEESSSLPVIPADITNYMSWDCISV